MKAGLFSKVCTKLGWSASFKRTVIAPSAPISLQNTGDLSFL